MNKSAEKESNFIIQKVYVKDISFESSKLPETFKTVKKFLSEITSNVRVDKKVKRIEVENFYEVELTVNLKLSFKEKTIYIMELSQVGIFTIENMDKEQKQMTLEVFCPNLLFPYAKDAVENLIDKTGFPHINLLPVNFDEMYREKIKFNSFR